ncbi:MAG: efflux RND transporter periplasmic adaptor subunit [Chloroflexota bacterium]
MILIVLGGLLVAAIAVGGYFGYQYLDSTTNDVSTNNALVVDPAVPVSSLNPGRIATLEVGIGARVRQGDVLARIQVPSVVGSLPNGAPNLEYTGAAGEFVDVRAPIDGVVIAVPSAPGQMVGQGQALVTLVDPSRAWITANVDENDIARVKVGQDAQVYIPAVNAAFSGRVQTITPATAASFLPTPYTNATGDFTQVDQLVPVNIELQSPGAILYPGASAVVTIKVSSSFP